ncbi:MAG: hypothetical protein ABF449_08765, partial [Ethanoligenens sp.]
KKSPAGPPPPQKKTGPKPKNSVVAPRPPPRQNNALMRLFTIFLSAGVVPAGFFCQPQQILAAKRLFSSLFTGFQSF